MVGCNLEFGLIFLRLHLTLLRCSPVSLAVGYNIYTLLRPFLHTKMLTFTIRLQLKLRPEKQKFETYIRKLFVRVTFGLIHQTGDEPS